MKAPLLMNYLITQTEKKTFHEGLVSWLIYLPRRNTISTQISDRSG